MVKSMAVVNDDESTPEILATEIKKLSDAVRVLLNGPLRYESIVHLIQLQVNVGKPDIRAVLQAIRDMAKFHLQSKAT